MFRLFTPFLILLLVIGSLFILEERKTFDVRTLVHINPIPHTHELIKEKKYQEAQEYLTYFLEYDYVKKDPNALKLMQTIQTKRNSLEYKKDKFLEGIIQGHSDEDIGRASAIASDFLVVGDIRDLAIEGMHYNNGEKVDKLMVALSSLGLLATASTLSSLGATTPIKGSLSLLKYAKRSNKVPLWLQTKLIKQIEVAQKTKSLKEIKILLAPIEKLYNNVGVNQALNLLKKSRNLKELTALSKLSSRFGKKSQVLLNTTNNSALNYIKKMPNVSTKNFLYASTYGEKGLKALHKLGTNKFITRVGFNSNLAKTTYKGNLNSLFNLLQKTIPNKILYLITFFGLFYFIWKFFKLSRRLLS